MIKKTLLMATCLAVCCMYFANAQQGQSVSGGVGYGTGGTMSYTIGQHDYITNSGNAGVLTQGLQQPIEIMIASGINENNIPINCTAFPNPSSDFVILKTPVAYEGLSYLLYNTSGSILGLDKHTGMETRVSLKGLADGIYYIRILNNNKEEKTFIIIKHS